MRLENKVALISGGARGMGAAEAKLFAREGAQVVIGDLLEEDGRRVEADRIAEIRRSTARRPPESETVTWTDRQRVLEGMQEGEARKRQLEELDRDILARIERRFGQDIPQERLQSAQSDSARFLDHQSYEAHLKKIGLPEPSGSELRVLGDYRDGQIFVDINHPELPRTLAHERLHQLADNGFQVRLGGKLNEGASEYLASRLSPDLHIKDGWASYSSERRVVEMLDARVGEKAIAQAYFKGDWRSLENQLEAQLGTGALDRLAQAGQSGSYEEAERVLKGEG